MATKYYKATLPWWSAQCFLFMATGVYIVTDDRLSLLVLREDPVLGLSLISIPLSSILLQPYFIWLATCMQYVHDRWTADDYTFMFEFLHYGNLTTKTTLH